VRFGMFEGRGIGGVGLQLDGITPTALGGIHDG
jgi:hypothetical protein